MNEQWRNTGAALTRLLERATPDSIQAEDVAIVRAELDQLRQRLEVCDYDAGKKTQTITELKGFIDTLRSRLAEYEGIGAKLALAEQEARRWRDRWVDYRTAYWRPTQPYEQARFLGESEAIDLENKFQEARDRRAAIDGSGESTDA